jgi:hypothetical protein
MEQSNDIQSARANPETLTLSVGELISRAQARLDEIRLGIVEGEAAVAEIAEGVARDGASQAAMQELNDRKEAVDSLERERGEIEDALVTLRAAQSKVRAQDEAAAADTRRQELAGDLDAILSRALELSQDQESAVTQMAAVAKEKRELKKRWREAVSAVVGDLNHRVMVNSLAEPLFSETPSLDQFLTVDAQLLAGSGALATDRAQKVRDRIAEATA